MNTPYHRPIVSMCIEECCNTRPWGQRWWHVHKKTGGYQSYPTWEEALRHTAKDDA